MAQVAKAHGLLVWDFFGCFWFCLFRGLPRQPLPSARYLGRNPRLRDPKARSVVWCLPMLLAASISYGALM